MLYKRVKDLFFIKKEIISAFEEFHSITKETDYLHISPFLEFLGTCINLEQQRKKWYKTYKIRLLRNRGRITHTKKFKNDAFLKNSLIIISESRKQGFGQILDFYGDSQLVLTESE